jgi:hypothetical protein
VSIDPLAGEMPFATPYSYAANNPVVLVDVDGLAPGGGSTQNQPKQESGKSPQPNGPQGEGQSGLPNPNASSPNFLNGTVWNELGQSEVNGADEKTQGGNQSSKSAPSAKPGLAPPVQPYQFPGGPNIPIKTPPPVAPPPGIETPIKTPGPGGLRWLVPGALGTAALTIAFVLIPSGSSSTNNQVPDYEPQLEPYNPPVQPPDSVKIPERRDNTIKIALGDQFMLPPFAASGKGIPFTSWASGYDFKDKVRFTQKNIENDPTIFVDALDILILDPRVKFNFLLSLSWIDPHTRLRAILSSTTIGLVADESARRGNERCALCIEWYKLKPLYYRQPGKVEFWKIDMNSKYVGGQVPN